MLAPRFGHHNNLFEEIIMDDVKEILWFQAARYAFPVCAPVVEILNNANSITLDPF